jgi:hypothetical protein
VVPHLVFFPTRTWLSSAEVMAGVRTMME